MASLRLALLRRLDLLRLGTGGAALL